MFRILYGLCSEISWLIVSNVFIFSYGLLTTLAYKRPFKNVNPFDYALKCVDSLINLNCYFLKNCFYNRIGLTVEIVLSR